MSHWFSVRRNGYLRQKISSALTQKNENWQEMVVNVHKKWSDCSNIYLIIQCVSYLGMFDSGFTQTQKAIRVCKGRPVNVDNSHEPFVSIWRDRFQIRPVAQRGRVSRWERRTWAPRRSGSWRGRWRRSWKRKRRIGLKLRERRWRRLKRLGPLRLSRP